MDEFIQRRITNIINEMKNQPINVKHLMGFLLNNSTTTRNDLEKHLRDRGYISISKNHMISRNSLIEYCKLNKISNNKQLKNKLFIDYALKEITISIEDIIIAKKSSVANKLNYDSEANINKHISIKTTKKNYVVASKEDLINFGLDNTYISFQLLEEYCKLFAEESQFEIRHLLNDRDIKLTSDFIDFVVYRSDEIGMVADEDVKSHMEMSEGYSNYLSKIVSIDPSIADISACVPSDIKNIIIDFILDNKLFSDNEYKNKDNISKYNQKMLVLGIIKLSESKVIVDPVTYNIIYEINKDIQTINYLDKSRKKLRCYYDNKTFYTRYGHYIREILIKNKNVRELIDLIERSNKSGRDSIYEIIDYCVRYNYEELFIKTFIGSQPTNGVKPIKQHVDVCFNCKDLAQCIGNKEKAFNKSDISILLMDYRNNYSKICLNNIVHSKNISILQEKPILTKFLVSYNTVVNLKAIFIYLGIIEKHPILYKNQGEYCPKKDIWRLK